MSTSQNAIQLLKKHGLRNTLSRQRVLNTLIDFKSALTQQEIETALDNIENRVTVYRVLKDLEQNGILHRIGNPNGRVLYAVCHDNTCDLHAHQDQHLHFSCTQCQKVYCLDSVQVPDFRIPVGYALTSLHMIAEGICASCNT
jgi:Fur family ferric uptake transcriptional regulator